MSIPRYRTGERVRFLAEGTVAYVRHAPCEAPHPGALTIAVPLEGGGTYDVTVPLGAVTIERLAPAWGEPQPEEVWQDATGVKLWAYRSTALGKVVLRDGDGTMFSWQGLHADAQRGPITRVYPPAPAADTTSGQAEETSPEQADEPRLMLDDVWEDRVGDIWRVVADATAVGGLRLMLVRNGGLITWTDVVSSSGPLVLLERAGYRRTETVVSAGRLRPGMVVSCEEWEDGAPVGIISAGDAVGPDEGKRLALYRPWPLSDTFFPVEKAMVDPAMKFTLWTGQAVTA